MGATREDMITKMNLDADGDNKISKEARQGTHVKVSDNS